MGIKKNPHTDLWEVSVSKRHPKTRQPKSKRRIGIKSEAKAKRTEKELYLELEDELRRQVIPTWRRCVSEFLQDFAQRDVSLKTVESYKLCLERHTLEIWGERLVNTINEHEIRSFINSLAGKVSPSHQKNVLKFIRAVLTYASSKHYITHISAPKMKFRIGDKLKGTLTENQVKLFLTKAKEVNSEWFSIWATALYTGMRNGELYSLTWDKVDFENNRIKVDCSWNSKDGFKSTKSGDDRWVLIAQELKVILLELKDKSSDSPFVLPRISSWDKGEQARELRFFLMGLGLPRIRFHDLRATSASIMLSKGVEPLKVMIFFGWKDLKTMSHYVRKAAVDIQSIAPKLDFFSKNSEK
jgi:integrase